MDILSALNIIHKNGIIHCDIKPQNMLVFSSDSTKDVNLNEEENDESVDSIETPQILKLTDFGLAHIIPAKSSKAFMKYRCGTHGYTAPEVGNVS